MKLSSQTLIRLIAVMVALGLIGGALYLRNQSSDTTPTPEPASSMLEKITPPPVTSKTPPVTEAPRPSGD